MPVACVAINGARMTTLGASVDVKLVQPVFPGQRLEYRARLVLASGNFARFEVEATVNDVTVASGFMTGMQIPRRDGPGVGTA